MRVALDATPLTVTTGGIRRYVAELSRALAAAYPEDEYRLLSDQPFEPPCGLSRGSGPRNALDRRWWLWGIERRNDYDVFHGTDFSVPYLARRPSVLTLHDLAPWMGNGNGRVRARTPWLLGLGLATMVITCSQAVRAEAIERFRIHPARVVAVPLAAAGEFRPARTQPARPYFFYAGSREPRKNVAALAGAWRELRREFEVELLLAGRGGGSMPEPGLRELGEVSDAELAGLYSGAVAVVYPSTYEGFGLPVLEAMQSGACVIAGRAAAVEEAAGGAAVIVDSGRALAAAMRQALIDPGWAAGWREKGLARARQFSWERTAALTRAVYVEARRRFHS
ncbi:MAG: glycosyltransferase family 4 protein [Acidobacteria bacterium]|nr:glycosyltransferase family 4 protein [Acidobacteriota bacterium]